MSGSRPDRVLDPVCGMTISPDDAVGHVDYKGQTYYFCGKGCMLDFKDDPAPYFADDYTPSM